jgi:hypothetical protein
MKKAIGRTIAVLVVAALALAIIPTTRDEIHWRWASHQDDTASYESYAKTWPEGRHAAEAQARYDERGWVDAQAANTVQDFERYVQLHAQGKHVAAATGNIEALHWQEATATHTITSYRSYISAHPQGRRHAQEAETRASALRADEALFNAALRAATEASLRAFLAAYPGHAKEAAAQKALTEITEGRDVVDLLREKKIEVQAQGDGIEKVSVRIRRLVAYPLAVRIPVGTFFVSVDPSAQNMVTTVQSKARLRTDEWDSVYVDAACANRPRNIPGSSDRFTVQRSPQQVQLARLMPILAKAGVDPETRQAAVWIVTDNADYGDLGILVARPIGSRVINEQEAARAMRICDEAGIDITRKAIWSDRKRILSGLEDGDLKAWLEQRK